MLKLSKTEAQKAGGFTIIELIVVITIISLLSLLMLANYNQGNKKLSLELQAYKIASDIRQAQENSLGAVQVPSFSYSQVCGYGIYFDVGSNSYALFADTNPAPSNCGYLYDSSDQKLATIYANSDFFIKSITAYNNNIPTSVSKIGIVFIPPNPATKIKSGGSGDDYSQAVIVVGSASAPDTMAVIINKAGLIYVQ